MNSAPNPSPTIATLTFPSVVIETCPQRRDDYPGAQFRRQLPTSYSQPPTPNSQTVPGGHGQPRLALGVGRWALGVETVSSGSQLTSGRRVAFRQEALRAVPACGPEIHDQRQIAGEHDDGQLGNPAQRCLLRPAVQGHEQRALPRKL